MSGFFFLQRIYKLHFENSYYEKENKLVRIHGEGSVEDIFSKLSGCINTEMEKQSTAITESNTNDEA